MHWLILMNFKYNLLTRRVNALSSKEHQPVLMLILAEACSNRLPIPLYVFVISVFRWTCRNPRSRGALEVIPIKLIGYFILEQTITKTSLVI